MPVKPPGTPAECTCSPLIDVPKDPNCPTHSYELGDTYRHGERVQLAREAVLETARKAIVGDRQQAYGPPTAGFERAAAMWSAILGHPVSAEQFALCMAALKIARLAETPTHEDSWVDLAGYAALGAEVALDHTDH